MTEKISESTVQVQHIQGDVSSPTNGKVNRSLASRPMILIGTMLILVSTFSLFGLGAIRDTSQFHQLMGIGLTALGVALVVFDELFVKNSTSSLLANRMMQRKLAQLETEIAKEKSRTNEESISAEDYKNVLNEVKSDVSKKLTSDLISSFKAEVNSYDAFEQTQKASYQFRARVESEIRTLSSRANVNLFIGSVTTVLGISVLAYMLVVGGFVYDVEHSMTGNILTDYILYYIPRLSVVLFIEVFSYFFLRLYRANLNDMKYFQNELTNIESKLTAINIAVLGDDNALKAKVVESLLATERNFVLKKGETTIDLEVSKMEVQKSVETTRILQAALKETRTLLRPRR
ncbi:hypothetical protein [Vibrio sagamiensis]|uniref:Uncharacterized protein n=1 Tax=Vibrio sagamiensis NBRC 104589 TaxID=1219064 RepID=A0A511QKG3_9VIBR|nr:hypothetical protein [Vibrio sagamiensis]PNQ54331.1 hypothetical protein C1141_16410 [Vibrio agarivorans]GEM77677.1 hypothetical protein VSA01S_37890 [Vibrio sagamiensis NBRC 104589]